eukprot:gnl/MRDRNA2_/MRDRNA2_97675_c0_seq1.p1 gnl/MRDRNA2_/MRDRNA2_97675_c0~~gnl/MRDRNA2_/MRDRNA2_97675_c0_seq1.p1  ORF type:complete len:218 (-),score=57.70 gnl/MRDRNA2_/MRDRNA2_97675_c0_seq1:65-718(-)
MEEIDDLENLASGNPTRNSPNNRPRGSEIDDLENLAGGAGGDMSGGAGGRAAPGPRPRNQVGAGWGFGDTSNTTSAPAGGGGGESTSATPMESAADKKKSHFDGDDDVIPVIPDLEEEAEEDITRQVAAPPIAYSQNVRSIREMDSAISSRGLSQLPTTPEEGVDLAILTQCLCAEHQVFEEDSQWDHELIFQEVASDINAELNAQENDLMELNGTA